MKYPLVLLTCFFCLGIFLAQRIKIPFFFIFVLAWLFVILCCFSFQKDLEFDIFLICLAFCLGAILLVNCRILPRDHVSGFTSCKNDLFYTLKGSIHSQPEFKNNRTTFIFEAREIECAYFKQKCSGLVLVYLKGRRNFRFAEQLTLIGNLYRPYSFGRARQRTYRDYLSSQGIFSLMQARFFRRSGKFHRTSLFRGFTLSLKEKIERIFLKYVPDLPASIIDAMVLGEKKNIPPLIYNSMVKSGTVHILVVSGFNVGIIGFIVHLFLKIIRIPRQIRFYPSASLLIIYCVMTGASTPVVRATVMGIFFMLGNIARREPDIYNSLALAALFILGINPRQLFDVGFQLSFASVISIAYLYPKITSLLRLDSLKRGVFKFLIDGCLVSFSAWLGTAGFIAYYFGLFSPVTVLANLFIVPLATFITLSGLSLVMAAILFTPLAVFFASGSELAVALLLKLNTALIKIPHAYFYLS